MSSQHEMKAKGRIMIRLTTALLVAIILIVSPFARISRAQNLVEEEIKPNVSRSLGARLGEAVVQTRKDGYTPMQIKDALPLRESSAKSGDETNAQRRPARLVKSKSASANLQQEAVASSRIPSRTP